MMSGSRRIWREIDEKYLFGESDPRTFLEAVWRKPEFTLISRTAITYPIVAFW